MSTSELIRQYVQKLPAGEPFTPAAFLGMGARASVDQVLSRLAKAGAITRVTRGVFVRATESRHLGKVLPEPSKVAETVAKAKGASLQVHGAEAARRFELTTQTPTQPVFYTSGPSKRFRMGKMEVVLKHAASRKLAFAGRPAGVALSALWYLGKNEVTLSTIEKIRRKLPASEFEALSAAKASMPGWMAAVFYRYEQQAVNG
ncbi:MAG: uncharacterized protein JWQ90_3128 [Hydrocarboniphaga sp.]|uniref:DUF6088 family protein n=1 Tax=Hydrocarboniphaga sp. TaxID=2033016 RepID=UPI00261CDDE7|nr:DUF6088 family protein [Hydrocarboniphaga sp.]MDB5970678.1 uncharacterized protein [Hydrocarboniphaga sp.]